MARKRDIERAARERMGFERLRPGQAEAVAAVLDGHDTLAVMSTGYGKSAIYQLAAALIPGPTVVVSPLIALQRDQVESLEEHATGEAAALNAKLGERAREELLSNLEEGDLEYVFLAPEQLANDDVRARIAGAEPSLLVVDEAHCISEWGHDFRPEYLRLGDFAEAIGRPTLLALTATAAPPVRREIAERLGMRDPQVIVRGFDRPNLRLAVERFHDEKPKREALLEHVERAAKPGIVYVATRRAADEVAEQLEERGLRAAAYHAGLAAGRRDEVQERFMEDGLDAVVATIAFGMGVDKPNIRFVFHHDVSDALDAYWQEVGRGGRDGEPAEALLFYRPEDLGLRRFFAAGGRLDQDTLDRVVRAVRDHRGPVDPEDLREELDLSKTKLTAAVHRLDDAGAVEQLPDGRIEATDRGRAAEAIVEEAAEDEESREAYERSRVEMMRAYAEHDGCRRAFLLSYFGEAFEPPCGRCDNCDAGRGEADDPAEEPFAVGARVEHDEWGEGEVQRYDGRQMVVLFDRAGYRTLDVGLVTERGLLEEAG